MHLPGKITYKERGSAKTPFTQEDRARICNVLGAQESIPSAYVAWTRICKRLRSPEIDSKESFSPDWESIPGLLERFTNSGSGGPVR